MAQPVKPARERLFDVKPPYDGCPLYEVKGGRPVLYPSAPQQQTLESNARVVIALAGVRAGKTSIVPWWLTNEMQDKGPGNYVLAAPTFRLLDKAAVPELRNVMGRVLGLGEVVGGASGEFRISEEGHRRLWPDLPFSESRIVFGYAERPESLAALTAKGGALDECGQRSFKQESWEELLARVSIAQGRLLLTTRPYVLLHWLKALYDQAEAYAAWQRKGDGTPAPPDGSDVSVVNYRSIDNPTFPREEWDRAYRTMPRWKADMIYGGVFTRPAGAVYDCFQDSGADSHVKPGTFTPPPDWPIKCGIDFGSPNFAAIFSTEPHDIPGPMVPGRKSRLRPSGTHWVYAEYRPQESATVADHIAAMMKITGGRLPDFCAGGAASEQWLRDEFGAAGWPISEPPQTDVEVGIERVYEGFATRRLFIFEKCKKLIEDVKSYSREIDEAGNVLNDIENKSQAHLCDALRYLGNYLFAPAPTATVIRIR